MDYRMLTYEQFVTALRIASATYRQNFYMTKMADRSPDWKKLFSARMIEYPLNEYSDSIEFNGQRAVLSEIRTSSSHMFLYNADLAYTSYVQCLEKQFVGK